MQVENHDAHVELMEQEDVQQVSWPIGFMRRAMDGYFVLDLNSTWIPVGISTVTSLWIICSCCRWLTLLCFSLLMLFSVLLCLPNMTPIHLRYRATLACYQQRSIQIPSTH
jgi:hypothetical protein